MKRPTAFMIAMAMYANKLLSWKYDIPSCKPNGLSYRDIQNIRKAKINNKIKRKRRKK